MYKQILPLFIAIVLFVSCSKFAKVQKSDNVDLKFKAAQKYFENKDYYHAGQLYEELIPLLKGQSEAEKSQFFYAYCQYYQGQLILSAYYFKKFYETYPRSELGEEAYYMHCISLYEDSPDFELDQTNTKSALDAIQVFLEKFPNTSHLTDCNDMSDKLTFKLELKSFHQARLYYRMSDFKAGIMCFENVIKDYPSSKFVEDCHYLKILAQYKLARISIEEKKKERYNTATEFYYNFIDKYPNSRYLLSAQKTFEKIQKELKALESNQKKWYQIFG
ncbi:MAG: outer membrane protein assembly factor BamD [Cytophagales bacterium]|nr:outer membrane protein assembly factor BamD [Cytophagales bacterium]